MRNKRRFLLLESLRRNRLREFRWVLDDAECDPDADSPWFTDNPDDSRPYTTFTVLIPKRPPSRLQPEASRAEQA